MLLLIFTGGGAPAAPDYRACLTASDAGAFTLTQTDAGAFTLTASDASACD